MKLSECGWLSVGSIYSTEQVDKIKSYLNSANKSNDKVYRLNKADLAKEEIKFAISSFFDSIKGEEAYSLLKLSKVWYVSTSHHNSEPGKLPYIPHFDKRRFVKLMVYLNEVSSSDGPLCVAATHVETYESARVNLPFNYKELGLNSANNNQSFKELTLPSGAGVIFDTNCAHFAKPVEKNGHRVALRFDFQDYRWNARFDPLLTRLKNSII